MLAKYTVAAVAGSALLASVAFAQSPTATTDSAKNSDSAKTAPTASSPSSFQGDWRASKLVGLSVYNDNSESLGSINDLLTDQTGSIKAVVIGVGGFLGVGEHLVAVPLDKVQFVKEAIAYAAAAGSPNSGTAKPMTTPTATAPSTTTTGSATTPAAKANPWYPDHAVFNATKDELKAMPEFTYSTN